ncbi:MAG: HmuY family protein [Tenacibaculum sp.]
MRNLKILLPIFLFIFLIFSCSNDSSENLPPTDPDGETGTIDSTTTSSEIYEPIQYDNLYAPPDSPFVKFSFTEGEIVKGDNWDIAFQTTTIIVNGGEKVIDKPGSIERTGDAALVLEKGSFKSAKEAPVDFKFLQDAEGVYALDKGPYAYNPWYIYTGPPDHLVKPLSGKVLFIKTHDGHYVKMEILSYYKDLLDITDPTISQPSFDVTRFYTFRYVYNPNKGDKNLQSI